MNSPKEGIWTEQWKPQVDLMSSNFNPTLVLWLNRKNEEPDRITIDQITKSWLLEEFWNIRLSCLRIWLFFICSNILGKKFHFLKFFLEQAKPCWMPWFGNRHFPNEIISPFSNLVLSVFIVDIISSFCSENMNFILKNYNKYNNNIFQNTFLNNVREETEGFYEKCLKVKEISY